MIGVLILLALSILFRPLLCLADQEFSCGIPKKEIIGLILRGDTVDAQEYPWHSALFHWTGSDWDYICGGTLINNRYVITARHCTLENGVGRRVPINDLLVKLGLQEIHHENLHTQSFNVSAIRSVEDNKLADFQNDIALIKLNETVQFTDHILPACLVSRNVNVNDTGVVVGFGMTNNNNISKTLRKLSVPVLNTLTCLRRHTEFVHRIDENQLCAGHTDGRAVYNGDSGGGLLFWRNGTMQLGGIVSFSAARGIYDYLCAKNGYAVYTNIYFYLSWIESTIRDDMITTLRQRCGTLLHKSTMTMMIYKRVRYQPKDWLRFCVEAIISQRYILANGCYFPAYSTVRVALASDQWISDENFSTLFYRDVASILTHHALENFISLIRLDYDIAFNEHVQPICLPTAEELQYDRKIFLINWSNNSSSFKDATNFRKNLEHCKENCSQHNEPLAQLINNANSECLEGITDSIKGSLIGFYSHLNGFQQLVMLGGRFQKCDNNTLYTKLNYKQNIQWVYDSMEPLKFEG